MTNTTIDEAIKRIKSWYWQKDRSNETAEGVVDSIINILRKMNMPSDGLTKEEYFAEPDGTVFYVYPTGPDWNEHSAVKCVKVNERLIDCADKDYNYYNIQEMNDEGFEFIIRKTRDVYYDSL